MNVEQLEIIAEYYAVVVANTVALPLRAVEAFMEQFDTEWKSMSEEDEARQLQTFNTTPQMGREAFAAFLEFRRKLEEIRLRQ
jgi:hypothetical protein